MYTVVALGQVQARARQRSGRGTECLVGVEVSSEIALRIVICWTLKIGARGYRGSIAVLSVRVHGRVSGCMHRVNGGVRVNLVVGIGCGDENGVSEEDRRYPCEGNGLRRRPHGYVSANESADVNASVPVLHPSLGSEDGYTKLDDLALESGEDDPSMAGLLETVLAETRHPSDRHQV